MHSNLFLSRLFVSMRKIFAYIRNYINKQLYSNFERLENGRSSEIVKYQILGFMFPNLAKIIYEILSADVASIVFNNDTGAYEVV